MKKGLKFLFLISLFANLFLVSAAHQVSPASVTHEINTVKDYSVTITNTDVEDTNNGLTNANITQVDITLPSGLNFISGSESTTTPGTFSVASNVLTWTSAASLINSSTGVTGENVGSFSFQANGTAISTLNVTIKTTNSSGVTETGITVTVSDTQSPSVTLNSPANNEEDIDGVLVFDCTATDNYDLDSIALYIWDNSSSEIHKNILGTSGLSNQTDFDYTFSSDGDYKWNCFANDTTGNFNWASNRTIKISAGLTSCTPNWDCDESDWSVCADDLQTRVCNDLNSCGNNATKPAENQSCVSACVPEWDCTDWAPLECPESEKQTRTCVDVNDCDSVSGKPSEERACTPESSGPGIALIAGIIAVILIGGGVAGFFYFKSKSSGENIAPQTQMTNAYSYGNTQGNNQGYTYKYS